MVAIAAITTVTIVGPNNTIGRIFHTKRETTISGGRITKRIRGATTRLIRMGVEAGLHLPTSRMETTIERIIAIIETMVAPNTNKEEIIVTIVTSP